MIHTFLFFFILEGGHRPFFRNWRFLTSLFRLSLIFLASFIFIFCCSFSSSFDSNGSSSTDKLLLLLLLPSFVSEGRSLASAPSISADAFTTIEPLCLIPSMRTPLKCAVCSLTEFLPRTTLDTKATTCN
ncbi:hypothetical protein Hanom_Chr13g01204671 [Helianthus anomalus]